MPIDNNKNILLNLNLNEIQFIESISMFSMIGSIFTNEKKVIDSDKESFLNGVNSFYYLQNSKN